METILDIQNLRKVYGENAIGLNGVDIKIKEGEFVVVIGPSGAGKSTLLRCINRLIEATEGHIEFMDYNVLSANKRELREVRSNIGMIFQNYNLIHRSSVLENVLHGRLGHMNQLGGILGLYSQEDKLNAIKLLEEIGLKDQMYKRADELSGGQKQRVGICRALAQKPRLMLADEPIASLDPKSSKDVMDALYQSCVHHKIACIANLHQVDVAKTYATRIIGIRKGKVVFDGKPEHLTDKMIEYIYTKEEEEVVA